MFKTTEKVVSQLLTHITRIKYSTDKNSGKRPRMCSHYSLNIKPLILLSIIVDSVEFYVVFINLLNTKIIIKSESLYLCLLGKLT